MEVQMGERATLAARTRGASLAETAADAVTAAIESRLAARARCALTPTRMQQNRAAERAQEAGWNLERIRAIARSIPSNSHALRALAKAEEEKRAAERERDAIDDAVTRLAVEAQRAADEGRAVGHFQAALAVHRETSAVTAAPAVCRIATRAVATRRMRTCGGGRPAGRPARRSASSAGSCGDSDSSGSDPEPPPAPSVGRAGRLNPAHILWSRRRRLRLRAQLRRLWLQRWIGGTA